MATPSAYMTSMPMAQSQFGHHDPSFGTLPTYQDYHSMIAKIGGIEHLIQIDVHEAIIALHAQKDALLKIKVPTLGFTDPAFDYDLRPWFATPFSINGFGANKEDIQASRPIKMIGEDFMGNQYPLLFNKEGLIDYEQIAAQTPGELYTTLKAIYYVYSAEQVLRGEGFTKLPMSPYHQGSLLMLPPETIKKPFGIEIDVLVAGESVHQQLFEATFESDELYHINQFSLNTQAYDNSIQFDIFVETSAFKTLLPNQLAMTLEFPQLILQDGIAGFNQSDLSFEPLSLTQYFGLSHDMLSKVIDVLIPESNLSHSFQSNTHDSFNHFSDPNVLKAFYQEIKQGIADSSVPVMALSDYFASAQDIKDQITALNSEPMSKADHDVFTNLMKSMFQEEDLAYHLADSLDQMLTLDQYYPQSHFSFITKDSVDPSMLEVQLNLKPLDSLLPTQSYQVTSEGMMPLSDDQNSLDLGALVHDDPFFGDISLEHAELVGHRFEISPDALIHGAQIIHDFNWQNHDVIDLNQLFETLAGNILEPSISTATKGDELEIWIEDTSGLGVSEKIHVATVIGTNPTEDALPSIEQFIEFPS